MHIYICISKYIYLYIYLYIYRYIHYLEVVVEGVQGVVGVEEGEGRVVRLLHLHTHPHIITTQIEVRVSNVHVHKP